MKHLEPVHERPSPHVIDLVTRIPLLVCALALTLYGAETDLSRSLKGIEEHYNRAKTLKVLFTESYTVNGHTRQQENGELTLRKPGRMRWDYTTPAGKLFVSDGKEVFSGILDASEIKILEGRESARIRTGNAGGLKFTFNGKQIGILGPRGQVRTVVFTKNNYEVLPSAPQAAWAIFTQNVD